MMAWRYLTQTSNKEKTISRMAMICFAGTLISTFSLALVIAIMNGFEKTTHQKLRGIHSQLTIKSYIDALNFEKIKPILKKEFPQVAAFAPSTLEQVLIQNPNLNNMSNLIVLKGVDPHMEPHVSTIETKITSTPKKLIATLENQSIVLGEKLAESLNVQIGQMVNLLFVEEQEETMNTIKLTKRQARIGGIFKTGIEEFDENLAYCSLDFLNSLFDNAGVGMINLELEPNANEQETIDALKKKIHLQAYSWKDLYPALVSALKLEKYAMFFILSLIILVASMNIISLLFMYIVQKQRDIAILRTLGLHENYCRRIFLYIGVGITLPASILGLLLAALAAFLLERYPFITLPDSYYVSHLPAHMDWEIIGAVFFVITVISFISIWFSSRKTTQISICDVLRTSQ